MIDVRLLIEYGGYQIIVVKGNGMGRVVVSKSDDAAAKKPHPRAVSSVNLAQTDEQREISRSQTGVVKTTTARVAIRKKDFAQQRLVSNLKVTSNKKDVLNKKDVPNRKAVSNNKNNNSNNRVVSNRKASSKKAAIKQAAIKQDSTAENQPSLRNRVVTNNQPSNQRQGKFVDARRLPGLDFLKKTLNQTSGSLGMVTRPRIIDFRERLQEKKSAYLHFTVRRVVAIVLILVAICALSWLLFFSPVFRLKASNISISGSNEWVSKEKIASIASTQVDKSLFLVSSQEVIGQLNDIPGVTEAKVNKEFPQSLQIIVRAQRPAAMLKTRGESRLTAVDAQGRVLNAVAHASTQGIPVIEVSNIDRSLRSRAVLEAVKIVSSLPESLRIRVTQVIAKTQDSVQTELGGVHRTIVWGNSSQLALKKAIVAKIIDDPSKIGDKHCLDVSAPVRPILK